MKDISVLSPGPSRARSIAASLIALLMLAPAAASAAPGLIVTPTEMFLAEPDGSASFTVRLSDQPTGTVMVNVTDEDNGPLSDVTVEAPPGAPPDSNAVTLTFTTLNYTTPQTITVRVLDDHSAQGTHDITITNRVSQTTDAGYLMADPVAVIVHIADDDQPGVALVEKGGSTVVAETSDPTLAGDTYTLALTASPGSHGVTITPDPNPQLTFSPSSVTFNSSNYATPQTITVKAANDAVVEESPHATTITHTVSVLPAGGPYDPASDTPVQVPDVAVAIMDNDGKTLVPFESDGGTAVRGDVLGTYPDTANSDTYTVYLTQRPSHPVTVEIVPDDGLSVSPSVVTFNAGDEGVAMGKGKVITVTAAAPGLPGRVHHVLTSADSDYNGIKAPDLAVCRFEEDAGGAIVATTCPDAVRKTEGNADAGDAGGALGVTTLASLLAAALRRRRRDGVRER